MSAPLLVAPQALVCLLAVDEEERHWSVPERTLVPNGSSPASRDRQHLVGGGSVGDWVVVTTPPVRPVLYISCLSHRRMR